MSRIAALYVEQGGPYDKQADVDAWTVHRDARNYRGPYPVVAHPPCKRWGRYARGGPSARQVFHIGDDGQCFSHALWAVRTFGGVLEHPQASHAWRWHGLRAPPIDGGWVQSDPFGGFSCCVAQGAYGHRSQKLTWLYAVGADLLELDWGLRPGMPRLDQGHHTAAERTALGERHRRDRSAVLLTPLPFRDLLLRLARSARIPSPARQIPLFGA